MIKKALTLLVLAVLTTVALSAQQKTGRWTIYPTIADSYDAVIESGDRTYMLSGGTLYHYDDSDNEFYTYNATNKLSDGSSIARMAYDFDSKFLLVAYENGNMDIIYDDGKVKNLPEIKDAILTTGHDVNHISFGKGKIYVATKFGIVIYDSVKGLVVESGIYNKNIDYVFPLGDNLVLFIEGNMYYAPLEGRHNSFDKFTFKDKVWMNSFGPMLLSNTTLLFMNTKNQCYSITPNFAGDGLGTKYLGFSTSMRPYYSVDGVFVQTDTDYKFVASDGTIISKVIPEALKGLPAWSTEGQESVWVLESDGLARYDVSGNTPAMLAAASRPEAFTVRAPAIMQFSADGNRLYISDAGPTFAFNNSGDNYRTPQQTDIVENGTIRDVAAHNVTSFSAPDHVYDDETLRIGSCNRFAEDPEDHGTYHIASNCGGIYTIRDNTIQSVFNKYNSPINNSWMNRTMDCTIDPEGNLWLGNGYESGDNHYIILPASKRLAGSNVKKTDWLKSTVTFIEDICLNRDLRSIWTKKGNYFVISPGGYGFGLTFLDHKGTYLNVADDVHECHKKFFDTDGNSISYQLIHTIVEDADGKIWVGHDQGLFVVQDVADAFGADFRVKRPIVPRNDGTNYGDYLMEAENVYGIAVDPSNRKWIATGTSGVYLVSADGTQILAHYTRENSDLPDNLVWSVAADPHSNKVYFGTKNGIACYESDSAPASDDYSEVYAYPNPVRPEYDGWITVAGLMDNSLVKIADIAGNVFFQGQSEGGIVRWDGCNPDGQRVKSGVYLVFASQNGNGSSSGVVTKIMVVN